MKIDINKYIGRWFEIAKTPNSFEDNLTDVRAEYILNDDNTIKIVNTGYLNGKEKQIIGKAILTDKDDLLKVSFFPNVYTDYKILAISDDYSYALVGGNDNNLWMLGRRKIISTLYFEWFLDVAIKNGYDVSQLKLN